MPSLKDTLIELYEDESRFVPVRKIYKKAYEAIFGEDIPASRSYRYFSRLLQQEARDLERGMSLCLSSPDSIQDSTNSILMLAFTLHRELGARVLIVDATSSRVEDSVSARLGVDELGGFNQLLADGVNNIEDYIFATATEGVSVMPSGLVDSDTPALPREQYAEDILTVLAGHYDFCIFQQGSIVSDTRYLHLSKQVDYNFLVLRENQTLMSKIKDCQEIYGANSISNLKFLLAT